MGDQLLNHVYHRLCAPDKVQRPVNCMYSDSVVALIYVLAVLRGPSPHWAHDKRNWPLWMRRLERPSYSQFMRRLASPPVVELIARLRRLPREAAGVGREVLRRQAAGGRGVQPGPGHGPGQAPRRRRLSMVCSGIVLLLTTVAWVRSTKYADIFTCSRTLDPGYAATVTDGQYWHRTLAIELQQGAVYLQRHSHLYAPLQVPPPTFQWTPRRREVLLFLCTPSSPDVYYTLAGFSLSRWDRFSTSWRGAAVRVPLWPVASSAAVMPAWGLLGLIRRRRGYGAGCCPSCGYDLRATPQRCPECGQRADVS